jgi:dual specificity phosphatase 12
MHDQGEVNGPTKGTVSNCAHIFLHPLTWMRPSLFPGSMASPDSPSRSHVEPQSGGGAPLSGRLTCPNPTCRSNVGKFAWQGMQCSCGRWVVPAIGVARSKVDVVEKAAKGSSEIAALRLGAMGIRLPPHMRLVPPEQSGLEDAICNDGNRLRGSSVRD